MNKKTILLMLCISVLFIAATKYGDIFVSNELLVTRNATIGNGTQTAYINGSDGRFTGLIKIPYAELYNITPGGYTVTVNGINNFYPITNLAIDEIYEFIPINNGVQANKTGLYKLDYSASFGGGAGGTYYLSIKINSDEHEPCRLYRKLGSGGDVGNAGSTCVFTLNKGDNITYVAADYDTPAQNIVVWSVNANVVQIG